MLAIHSSFAVASASPAVAAATAGAAIAAGATAGAAAATAAAAMKVLPLTADTKGTAGCSSSWVVLARRQCSVMLLLLHWDNNADPRHPALGPLQSFVCVVQRVTAAAVLCGKASQESRFQSAASVAGAAAAEAAVAVVAAEDADWYDIVAARSDDAAAEIGGAAAAGYDLE